MIQYDEEGDSDLPNLMMIERGVSCERDMITKHGFLLICPWLQLRDVIDPKRHYKKGEPKTLPKYFQASLYMLYGY